MILVYTSLKLNQILIKNNLYECCKSKILGFNKNVKVTVTSCHVKPFILKTL